MNQFPWHVSKQHRQWGGFNATGAPMHGAVAMIYRALLTKYQRINYQVGGACYKDSGEFAQRSLEYLIVWNKANRKLHEQ